MPSTARRPVRVMLTAVVAVSAVVVALPSLAADGPRRGPAVEDGALPEPLKNPGSFVEPPAETRPGMRWWWQTPYDTSVFPREVDALADAGFGLAEIGFNSDGFGNPAQRDAMAATVAKAKERGLQVDITMGPGWPLTNAAVAAGTGLSQQELDYGIRDLPGGSTYSGPVPEVRPLSPCTAGSNPLMGCGGPGAAGKLVAVTGGRVLTRGTAPIASPPTQSNADAAAQATQIATVLDPTSLVDLTDTVDEAGNITWDVPAVGTWMLFAFYQRASRQDVMDHLSEASAKALTGYLDREVLPPSVQRTLPELSGSFFEDSPELVMTLWWTDDLLHQFARRKGYDLTKFLPMLFVPGYYTVPVPATEPTPEFDLPGSDGDRLRRDFLLTLEDLYVERHVEPFQEYARTHGMDYRAQAAYGGPLRVIRVARDSVQAGGKVDQESRNPGDPQPYGNQTWQFALDNYREIASGAHQGGSSDIAIELGGTNARDYMVGLQELKAIMDKIWAGGATRPIIHGLVHQPPGSPWPGGQRFFGLVANSWNPATFPEWKNFRALNKYWSRGNLVLRQGKPQVDVAVYRDGYTTWQATYGDVASDVVHDGVSPALPVDPLNTENGRPLDDVVGANTPKPFFDTASLDRRGYRVEYVDPEGLQDEAAGTGAVLFPDGPSYRAIVVDQRAMPAEAARSIAERAEAGLAVVVVGDPPSRGASATRIAQEDAAVREAFSRIMRAPRTAVATSQDDVVQALDGLNLEPTARWSTDVPVYSQHRRAALGDYFYLHNPSAEVATFTASFATSGSGLDLDLWSGKMSPLPVYRHVGGRVEVPLVLAPGATRVLAFNRGGSAPHLTGLSAGTAEINDGHAIVRDTAGGRREFMLSDGRQRAVVLPDPGAPLDLRSWTLQVEEANPDGPVLKTVQLEELRDWREISEVSGSAGTGTYVTTFDLPREQFGAGRGLFLDVGALGGSMQVLVNGARLTASIADPQRIDVSQVLRAGRNEVRIIVSTQLKNRLVALAKQGEMHGGLAAAQPSTQPYGLLGRVRVVPYSSAAVRLTGPGAAATSGPPPGKAVPASSGALPATGGSVAVPALALLCAAALAVRRRRCA